MNEIFDRAWLPIVVNNTSFCMFEIQQSSDVDTLSPSLMVDCGKTHRLRDHPVNDGRSTDGWFMVHPKRVITLAAQDPILRKN